MKIFKIVLIITSILWTVYNFIVATLDHQVINLVGLTAIVPVITALYSEIDWVYIKVNKFLALFSAKTVSFSPKFQYATCDVKDTVAINSQIRGILKDNGYNVIDKHQLPITDENIYLRIQSPRGLKADLSLTASPSENETIQLIMKLDYQVSYRDVSKCWEEFTKIKEELFATYAKVANSALRYDVTVATGNTRFNPFYRLTIRRLGKKVIDNFSLSFREENLKIETSLHQIYASSPDQAKIKKVIDEYVPLTKVQ